MLLHVNGIQVYQCIVNVHQRILLLILILIINTLFQDATRLTCQSSTRASNKRKHVTLTDKCMYMYTYKLAIEHIKHMSITVS